MLLWGGAALMPPPAAPARRPSLILPDGPLGLKSELQDESSQHSLDPEASCGADGPEAAGPSGLGADDLKVVDLRLKAEALPRDAPPYAFDAIKLSPPAPAPSDSPSPLASFTQQLQAIQNQVQTDKMVESVTAAIFNSADNAGQMYGESSIGPLNPMRRLISAKTALNLESEMKVLNPELMMTDAAMRPGVLQATAEQRLIMYNQTPRGEDQFNPFGVMAKMEIEQSQLEQRLAQQSAHMEALVEDAMKATAAMLPADAAKLDELVNSRVEDHLSGASSSPSTASHASDVLMSPGAAVVTRGSPADLLPPLSSAMSPDDILNPQVSPSMLCDSNQRMVMPSGPSQEELMMIPELPTSVKTPPAAVKSMILNAAAEILTSDTTMNALVKSAINTANILTTESAGGDDAQPPAGGHGSEPAGETPLVAMSQAVSQAVTQAVSQAVTQAVSQAVSQEMTAPVQRLTDMSDQDLLSYINPSTFDQGEYTMEMYY